MSGKGLFVVLSVESVIFISLFTFLYHLLKQQGRILLCLDDMKQDLANSWPPKIEEGTELTGLNVGARFPALHLPEADGREELKNIVSKRTLLVHWSAECGFCSLIGKDLALLESVLEKVNVRIILLSRDDGDATRKQVRQLGLKSPLLSEKDAPDALALFDEVGTPAAYLVDEHSRVERRLAVGADRVLNLARRLVAGTVKRPLPGQRPLSHSRIERNGLKAGTPAPEFRLPDLNGRTVSLSNYRGRKVMLVFADPHCGPCDEIAPELARLHREHQADGLALLMVGRGDTEENRQKAQKNGIEFPVVMQKRWELSKQYGIFATPVAFLINEEGIIARNVANGPDAILELIHRGLSGNEMKLGRTKPHLLQPLNGGLNYVDTESV